MKRIAFILITVIALASLLFYRSNIREREVVILSTNDIHATIDAFPRLVTAVNIVPQLWETTSLTVVLHYCREQSTTPTSLSSAPI